MESDIEAASGGAWRKWIDLERVVHKHEFSQSLDNSAWYSHLTFDYEKIIMICSVYVNPSSQNPAFFVVVKCTTSTVIAMDKASL